MNPSRFEERSAGNPHAAFCGSRRRVTVSGDLVTIVRYIQNQEAEERRLEQMQLKGL